MADGRWQMADGRWQMADGRWQMADGRWQMADKKKTKRRTLFIVLDALIISNQKSYIRHLRSAISLELCIFAHL